MMESERRCRSLRSGLLRVFVYALLTVIILLIGGEESVAADGTVDGNATLAAVHAEQVKADGSAKPRKKRSQKKDHDKIVEATKLRAMDDGAIVLNSQNYAKFMKSHPLVMVLYYAPWCYWSRATLPEYDAAARMLAHHDPPVILSKVNCTENEDIANAEDIREFPTVRFFIDGEAQSYDGRRFRTHIVHWIESRLDRDKALKSVAHLDELLKNWKDGHVVVVGAFPPDHNTAAYVSVARAFADDVFFADASDVEIIQRLKDVYVLPNLSKTMLDNPRLTQILTLPFIAVFSPHANEPGVNIYQGNVFEMNALRSFIRQFRFPVISRFNAETISSSFFSDPRPKLVLIVDSKANNELLEESQKADPKSPILAAFRKAAENFRDAFAATVTGNALQFEKQLVNILGADDEKLPTLRVMSVNHDSDGKHHPAHKFRPPRHVHDVRESEYDLFFESFLRDFVDHKIQPYFLSEAVPEGQYQRGWVQTVVGANFDSVVRGPDGDVFIEFYAPWCGYCRKMEPAYKQLAQKLKGVPGIIIAKIDATRNEVSGVKVSGYPTLLLYPHQAKGDPIIYYGNRSTEDMLEWLSTRTKKAAFDPEEVARVKNDDSGDSGILLEEL